MNKKGFTLVELLAVIIILALLAVLAGTSVTKVLDDSKNNLQASQVKIIEDAAKTWGAENNSSLPNGDSCIYLTLGDLKNYGLIDLDIKNPKTEKKLSNDIKIKITSKVSNYNTNVLIYEVDSSDIDGCDNYYNSICTLVSGNAKEIGSEYECKVNDKAIHNFFVLSTNDDGTYNLIMDSNINSKGEAIKSNTIQDKGAIAWINQTDYGCTTSGCVKNDKGPITAFTYLYNATKNWTNIPNIEVQQSDDNIRFGKLNKGSEGYQSITFIENETSITSGASKVSAEFKNLKSRLPSHSELFTENEVKCSTTDNRGWGSCPLWLVNYLNDDDRNKKPYENKTVIEDIIGYWTLTSSGNYTDRAWYVHGGGVISDGTSTFAHNVAIGVRPVITVKL